MKRILVVEDEENISRVYQKALSRRGYDVVMATRAQAGFEKLTKAGEEKIDLVISDVNMPPQDDDQVKNGVEMIVEASAVFFERGLKLPPVIFNFGGQLPEGITVRTLSIIGNAVFIKPVDLWVLIQKISELLAAG